jgi:hypothetical protein
MTRPQPLFALGLARSGTTALAGLLSSHPHIGLGIERYKDLYRQDEPLVDERLFERDRFFDFSDGWTNIVPDLDPAWRAHYAALEAKWDDLHYVGDKLVSVRIQHIWSSMPQARFVCIVRSVTEVAASWEARARNPEDAAWSARRGARRSVRQWNQATRRIRRALRQHPDRVVVVEHAAFFGDPAGQGLDRVLSWLGLGRTREIDQKFAENHARYRKAVHARTRRLDPEVEEFVRNAADMGAWRDVCEMAI